jgi:hypothetical protein
MLLPMSDSVPKPCKKGAKPLIRRTVGFTLKEASLAMRLDWANKRSIEVAILRREKCLIIHPNRAQRALSEPSERQHVLATRV